MTCSLKEWERVRPLHANYNEGERRQTWFEAIAQLIPAPPGWKCVERTYRVNGEDGFEHVPLAAIGLTRGGHVQPVPAGFDPHLSGVEYEVCVNGTLHSPVDGRGPCPACAAEANATKDGAS